MNKRLGTEERERGRERERESERAGTHPVTVVWPSHTCICETRVLPEILPDCTSR